MKPVRLAAALTFAAVLLLPVVATAQQKKPQGEPQRVVETMDIRVINIDVVVTDRKGNTIHGLKKNDFEVLENGVAKPVSNFYEVVGNKAISTEETTVTETAPAPAAQPVAQVDEDQMRRRIIFFIDNLSLAPFNRNRVFKEMKDFVKNVMRPGDEAMIATFNRSMKVRVPFTRDPVQLIQTLDIIAGESAMGPQNRSERKDIEDRIRDANSYDDAIATARTYAQSVDHDLRQTVESINALMSTLAGVEGKKILVLTSEGFPMQPGREAFYFIEDTARERPGWAQGSTLLEGMTFDASSLIQSVAKTANANGITMYTIHAGGLTVGNESSAENSRPTSMMVSNAIQTNSTESMQLMADMTGGIASVQTNNFAKAFTTIQRDLDSYYSIGYRATNTERVDRQRALEVRLKNNPKNQYIVRARQSFVEKSTYAEMSDRVIANLLYASKANDMHVLMRMSRPIPTDQELFRVPVEIQIPMESITLLPQGEEGLHVGGFDVYVVVANKDNDMSDVARKSNQITVPAADMPKTIGKFYTYTLELLMEPGLNRVSIGVVDNITNVSGFARDQIIAQDLR